jgi:hypothetical protein
MHEKGQWTANMDPVYTHLTAKYYTAARTVSDTAHWLYRNINCYVPFQTNGGVKGYIRRWYAISKYTKKVPYTDAIFSNMMWSVLKTDVNNNIYEGKHTAASNSCATFQPQMNKTFKLMLQSSLLTYPLCGRFPTSDYKLWLLPYLLLYLLQAAESFLRS